MSAAQARGALTATSRCQLEEMSVVTDEEGAQALGIVRRNGLPHARPLRQGRPPGAQLRRVGEDVKVGQRVEQIEIAKHRPENRIDQAEALTCEIRPLA